MKFMSGLATFAVVTGVIYYGFNHIFAVEFTAVQAAFITLLAYLAGMIVVPPEVNVAVLTKADLEEYEKGSDDLSK